MRRPHHGISGNIAIFITVSKQSRGLGGLQVSCGFRNAPGKTDTMTFAQRIKNTANLENELACAYNSLCQAAEEEKNEDAAYTAIWEATHEYYNHPRTKGRLAYWAELEDKEDLKMREKVFAFYRAHLLDSRFPNYWKCLDANPSLRFTLRSSVDKRALAACADSLLEKVLLASVSCEVCSGPVAAGPLLTKRQIGLWGSFDCDHIHEKSDLLHLIGSVKGEKVVERVSMEGVLQFLFGQNLRWIHRQCNTKEKHHKKAEEEASRETWREKIRK